MPRFLLRLFLFIAIILNGAGAAQATHIYGADFFYEHVSGNTYKISLVIYGDCKGSAFPNLQGATCRVDVLNGRSLLTTLTLYQSGNGVEVTPVCSAQKSNTQCSNLNSTIPGVTRYIYTTTYTLPYTSANWMFRFGGDMPVPGGINGQAGRSSQITNVAGGGGVTVLEAQLNNLVSPNSSPQFTTLPTPFYCVNIPQQYNLGATDANGDSLGFALVPGLSNTGVVSYNSGYSGTNPLDAVPGSFSFSSATGQMNFTPASVQQSLVVQQVNEYRNGVLVGTAMREMNFIVLSNCNTNPSTNGIDTTAANNTNAGGIIIGKTDFNICTGVDSGRFRIIAFNPTGDTITASLNGLPFGSTATIANNNTPAPVITVVWKNPTVAAGNYTFFVTSIDNGCPLQSQSTQAYTIHVYRPNELATSILAPTQCVHKALVNYQFAYGLAPRNITISKNGAVIRSFRDSTGQVADSLGVGTYSFVIQSDKLACPTLGTLTVVDSGLYPYRPSPVPGFYCKFDTPSPIRAIADSGAILRWYDANYNPINAAPTPRTDTTGLFIWFVDQKFKVCSSLKDTVKVYVTLRPIADMTLPDRICLNDTATIDFTGKVGVGPILEYHWDFDSAGYVAGTDPGPYRLHWYDTGAKTIRLRVDENKCPSFPIQHTLYVKPVPFAGFDVNNVCQYAATSVTYNTRPLNGQTFAWTFGGADLPAATGMGPFYISYHTTGEKRIALTVDVDGCSDTDSKVIEVYPVPDVHILNTSAPVCVGDKLVLIGSGGTSYHWSTGDSALLPSDNMLYPFQILRPETFKLYAYSEHGCVDSTGIAFRDVQPCCNFSYPNAFTPNGDGRNDRFHVITYGNQLEFELSIYNRWGQRVYYGIDAQQGWDGTYGGKPCDAGVYFYRLAAKCFTGREEEAKGELMLVR